MHEAVITTAEDDLLALTDEARRADLALRALLADDACDTTEIPDFDHHADAASALVDEVCAARASSLAGIITKARLAEHFGRYQGDKGARLALSVVADLLALSASTPS